MTEHHTKITETCSCGCILALEDVPDAVKLLEEWRIRHRCAPPPWRTDPTGSLAAGTQIGFRHGRGEVTALADAPVWDQVEKR